MPRGPSRRKYALSARSQCEAAFDFVTDEADSWTLITQPSYRSESISDSDELCQSLNDMKRPAAYPRTLPPHAEPPTATVLLDAPGMTDGNALTVAVSPTYGLVSHREHNDRRLDAADISRVQTEYERERYHQCCSFLDATSRQFVTMLDDTTVTASQLSASRQQLLADAQLVSEQHQILRRAEADLNLWEAGREPRAAGVSFNGRSEASSKATDHEHVRGGGTSIIEQYILRAGDASVARERIDEFDREASLRNSHDPDLGANLPLSHSEELRRWTLERDFECALRDAEMLEAACHARGYSTELARRRRGSAASAASQ